eukprot:GGOE01000502.1.p1 GENE.GGOE01000502.1~~GGOE01000502.1.p1  ORF type:complete len:186 (-),score=29.04 GGOE01000502.1:316-873(-)
MEARCFLLLHAHKDKINIGSILRSAVAFHVKDVLLYGPGKVSTHGSQMGRKAVETSHFLTLQEAIAFCKAQPGGCTICGVVIDVSSQPVEKQPFRGNTGFLLGHSGRGLTSEELQFCEQLVSIAQYSGAVPSLGSVIAGSIVLHHFGLWAGKQEQERKGQKFVVCTTSGRWFHLPETAPLSSECL